MGDGLAGWVSNRRWSHLTVVAATLGLLLALVAPSLAVEGGETAGPPAPEVVDRTAQPSPAQPSPDRRSGDVCTGGPTIEFGDEGSIALVHLDNVRCMAAFGITIGVDDVPNFAPGQVVDRQQMATFIARMLAQALGGDTEVPPVPSAGFADVAPGSVHAPAVDWLAALEVTGGVAANQYGPGGTVTRQQMASFIARALQALGLFEADDVTQIIAAADVSAFPDLLASSAVHRSNIQLLQALGVVDGLADGTFGPDRPVTRQQMAGFITRSLRLLEEAGRFEGRFVGFVDGPDGQDPDGPDGQDPDGPDGQDPDGPAPEPDEGEVRVTTDRLPAVQRGLSYGVVLEAAGGQPPYRWEVGGLPEGLEVGEDGRIVGWLEGLGTWSLDVRVQDATGQQAQAQLPLEAQDAGVPEQCVGRDCALLEPFDGSEVQLSDQVVDWTTFELEVGQVEAVQVQDFRIDEQGQVQGRAQLTVADLAVVPEVEDVLVVPEAAHPDGHVGMLIVQAEQVEPIGSGRVTVSGPLVGLMSAYHSGVVHVREGEATVLDTSELDTSELVGPSAVERSGLRCTRDGEQSVSVDLTPRVDGDVYVRWRLGVPQQVEVTAEVGVDVGARVALSGQIDCEIVGIPTLRVAKGPVIFGLGTTIEFGADAAFDGSVSTSVACSTTFGYNRGEPASFGCAGGAVDFALAAGAGDNAAQARVSAALDPSISMAQVVGVSGSMGATFRAHLTPLQTPQARLDVEIPTTLEGCIGCDLPLVGTLLETTFVDETFGPRTLWSRNVYQPPAPDPTDPDPTDPDPTDPDPTDPDPGPVGPTPDPTLDSVCIDRPRLLDELGEIATTGQVDRFPLELTEGTRVAFVANSFSARVRWELIGPRGDTVFGPDTRTRILEVGRTGDYELLLYTTTDVTGSYDFEVFDVTQPRCTIAMTGLPQQVFADGPHERLGQLSTIGDVHEYRITLAEGQRLVFRPEEFAAWARWELLGPLGEQVWGADSRTRIWTVERSGEHVLRLFASGINTSSYGFEIYDATDPTLDVEVTSLPFSVFTGDPPFEGAGTLGRIGDYHLYRLELNEGQRLVFAAEDFAAWARWELTDSRGEVMWGSDSRTRIWTVERSGEHVLRLFASGINTSSYGFEIYDATDPTLDVAVTSLPFSVFTGDPPFEGAGVLGRVGEYHIYRLSFTAGQRVDFASEQFAAWARWELTGPRGQTVFTATSASREVEIAESGTYQLRLFATGTNTSTYGFTIAPTG